MRSIASKIVADAYERYGRDVALAVGGALHAARDMWNAECTEKYGEITKETLPTLFIIQVPDKSTLRMPRRVRAVDVKDLQPRVRIDKGDRR